MPWIVVVGRGWADGVVELRNRFRGEPEIAAGTAVAEVASALAEPLSPDPGTTSVARTVVPGYRCRPGMQQSPATPGLYPSTGPRITAHSVSAVTPNARSSSVPACSITARQATAQSSSIRTASLARRRRAHGNGGW